MDAIEQATTPQPPTCDPAYSDDIARMYADAFRRIPETDEEIAWAEWNAREAVEEEPW